MRVRLQARRATARIASRLAALAVLAVLASPPAFAGDAPPCAELAIDADPAVAQRIRDALADRDDVDHCARVRVRARRGVSVVEVVLPDGRGTSRRAARPNDIVPIVEALLLVPRAAPLAPEPVAEPAPAAELEPTPAAELEPASPTPPPADEPPPIEGPPEPETRERAASDPTRSLGVELSILSSARMGDDQVGFGLGALAFLEARGFLGGFSAHADYLQEMVTGGPPSAALSLALLGGRRVRLGSVALDAYGGPGLAFQGTHRSVSETPTGRTVEERSTGGQPRAFAGARLSFRSRSVLRPFVGLDADIGAQGDVLEPGAHRLPLWTVGLALGMTVGTP